MSLLAAVAALALGAFAQGTDQPAAAAPAAPQASTATAAAAAPQAPAVAQSTSTAAPSPEDRPIKVFIHKESKDWEPISVRGGGTPGDVTRFQWRVHVVRVKGKKQAQGNRSSAKVFVRVRTEADEKHLVVSIFPKALLAQRTHVELRLLIIEGYLEKAQVVEVDASGGGPYDDAAALTAKGLDFQEESPESAEVRLTAVNPAPGKESFNAGLIGKALFAERHPSGLPDLGRVDLEYSSYGVLGPARPHAKGRAAKRRAPRRG